MRQTSAKLKTTQKGSSFRTKHFRDANLRAAIFIGIRPSCHMQCFFVINAHEWYPVSRHGDVGHPASGHLTSDILTLNTGIQDIYCQKGLWTPKTNFVQNPL